MIHVVDQNDVDKVVVDAVVEKDPVERRVRRLMMMTMMSERQVGDYYFDQKLLLLLVERLLLLLPTCSAHNIKLEQLQQQQQLCY